MKTGHYPRWVRVVPLDRSNEILREEFSAAGWTEQERPIYAEGELRDGSHQELAARESEDSVRAQCREWIAAC